MLSDAGSKVIRTFGILNTNIPEDHPLLYGIPFPGDYLIAPDGTVRDKLFLPSYEHRPSASQMATRHRSGAGANSIEIKTDVLNARISLSTDRCFPGQELGVTLEVHLQPGWHIYGEPLPKNYQPTLLQFEGHSSASTRWRCRRPNQHYLRRWVKPCRYTTARFVRWANSASGGVRQSPPSFLSL